ncbi:hypothetical protein F8S09_16460 [Deinococcus sp. SDU3-2]|uniref:Uncharacterized protein n=1 Tax=Deinococcus terrestris TaxID=2651870 RepID=A0A7X1NYP7_9DEIO|nr:hypothetical protein [Deinococcus terrestris]MPY68250.1 hypothetical protein [Deinococcus terrestris]
MTARTTPVKTFPQPRAFTPEEVLLRQQAQQRLLQQRINVNAQVSSQKKNRSFEAAFRANVHPRLLPEHQPQPKSSQPIGQFRNSPRLASETVLPACLDAALDRIKRPRPGTPAARAAEAVERARPIVEAYIRRRDARHNALMVLRALTQAAYTLIERRGQSQEHTTTYTFFTVLDLLPIVTRLSSDQCERATRKLQDIGLIHKSSGAIPMGGQERTAERGGPRLYRGGTWTTTTFLNAETGERTEVRACAGTWIAVLLRPAPGMRARVIAHELPACPRDLTADRKKGRTAWQFQQEARQEVRESILLTGDKFEISPLLMWSLPEKETSNSLGTSDSRTSLFAEACTPQELIWSLSRIVSIHPHYRREAVQEGATHLTRLLHDAGWERHYYRILWRATEAEFRNIPAYAQLGHALERTLIATQELQLIRPGAWWYCSRKSFKRRCETSPSPRA